MKKKPTSISRRLEQALNCLIAKDYESSLIHFFPALDKTAKLRRPKDGVGARIKKFLNDEESFITFIAFRTSFRDAFFDGLTFGDVIYKFGRTSIMHEGELDPRLSFNSGNTLQAGGMKWILPPSYIGAMITAVMAANENANEYLSQPKHLSFDDKTINANDIWGNKSLIQATIKMPDF